MDLLACACNSELLPFFLEKVKGNDCAALILEKQKGSLHQQLESAGIREVYTIPEPFYGPISSERTVEVLAALIDKGFGKGLFPISDFCANTALLLASITERVEAVSATAVSDVAVPLSEDKEPIDDSNREQTLSIQMRIVRRLSEVSSDLQRMGAGERSGEKPSFGLLTNFPYDCEVLYRYLSSAPRLSGNVLEVGCGIGYGAYAMVEANPELRLTAVDYDQEAIALARTLWGDHPRLSFEVGQAQAMPRFKSGWDAVVAFEVIEHLYDPAPFVAEVVQTLKDGGYFIGSTPDSSLFPYRVNTGDQGDPEGLRKQGIWPWHVQSFDEQLIETLLQQHGLAVETILYPTFGSGLSMLPKIRRSWSGAVDQLKNFDWSAADFFLSEERVPCFSGYSFIFSAVKR